MADDRPAAYFLGLDGGGTATRARLVTNGGEVLGEGLSGPSNLGLGVDVAEAAIAAAVDAAFETAGLPPAARSETAAGFGFASADIEGLPTIDPARFGFRSVARTSDAIAACLGAHRGGDGAILILGTGSQGVIVSGGVIRTIGGWGFYLGDQASGAALGRDAVRAAVLAQEDLAPSSPFTRQIMSFFDDSLDRAYVWALTAGAGDYAVWARPLVEEAGRGDVVARSILAGGTGWVELIVDRLVALGAAKVCLMGGLASVYTKELPERFGALLVAPEGDAMDGAILYARRAAACG